MPDDAAKKAEAKLNVIRKLADNKRCANCLEPGHPLLTAVVMPFKIFVCSTCKSAHQSFSHRCKSTQMSLWTMEEVASLEEKNGGGNGVAQETWLKDARDNDRPREGDNLDRFKSFVQKAYIDKRWQSSSSSRRESSPSDRRRDDRRKSSPSDRRRDDRRDRSASPEEPRRGSRISQRDPPPRSSNREAAPAVQAPPKVAPSIVAPLAAPVAASLASNGRRTQDSNGGFNPDGPQGGVTRTRPHDAFDPNAPSAAGGFDPTAGTGAGGFNPNGGSGTAGFDPNAGFCAGGFVPNAGSSAAAAGSLVGFFDSDAGTSTQNFNNSFDPFAAAPAAPSMSSPAPAGPFAFDPFASAASPANGQGMPMPGCTGVGAGGGYAAPAGQPPYPAGPGGGQQMQPGFPQQQMAGPTSFGQQSSFAGGMPGAQPGLRPNGMPGAMPNGMSNGVPNAMPNGMPSSAQPNGMSNAMGSSMSNGMPNAMQPNTMTNGMLAGMPNGMPNGMQPHGMPNGMQPHGMPNGMPLGMPGAMAQGTPGGMMAGMMPYSNGMPAAACQQQQQQAFGGPCGNQQGFNPHQSPQQGFNPSQVPQQAQQQAPCLENLQMNLQQLYGK